MAQDTARVNYDGRELSVAVKYQHTGDDWLVFLHGIGCAKESFEAVFDHELAQTHSILTLDFVGFGGSDKPDDFAYRLEDHAEIARLVIEQFKPVTVSLVAHSMGGAVGLLLAKKLPNLLGFINVEGNLESADAGIVSRRTSVQPEAEFIAKGYQDFAHGLKLAEEPAFQTWAVWYEASSPIAIHRSGASLVKWSDSGELMEYFNVLDNKAFIHGDRTDASSVLKQFNDVKVYTIPGSGHFMMLDNPTDFYAAIHRFLMD